MRILILNYEYPPLGGGGGVACQQIARELVKSSEVDVLTCGFKGLSNFEVDQGVKVYRVPVLFRNQLSTASFLSMFSYLPLSVFTGLSLFKKKRYDIINSWFAIPSGPSGYLLSRLKGVPNILTIIGGDIYDPTKSYSPHKNVLLNRVVRWVLEKAHGITAISSDTFNRTIQYYGVGKKIEVIPLGIQEPSFSYVSRSDLDLPEKALIISSVGRLVPRKGYPDFLKAIALLSRKDLKILIMGDGPEELSLKELTKKLNIKGQVQFMGFVPEREKFQYLSCSDLFVLPSLHEGFGLVFLEAMYCGLPVVTTENGGQRDFLKDGETGFLVPVGDPPFLAKRIEELLNDRILRQKMGQYNQNYSKNFLIPAVAEKYHTLFKKVVQTS